MKRRLYDLLTFFPVDRRTLCRAVERAGYRIVEIGKSGPLIDEADFETIKRDGIAYHKDRMTTTGIK